MASVAEFHKAVFDRIPAEKRARVLTVAADEFAEKGLVAANINIIADKADISVGSLYKYFESKTHLYLEVMNHGLALIEAALEPILEADTGLQEKIDAILDAVFSNAKNYPVMNRLYNRFTSEANSNLAKMLSARLESLTASAYSGLLKRAKAEGVVSKEINERVFAFCIDNLFITLQFSLSAEYWHDRMGIYLGDDIVGDPEILKTQISRFISRALGL